MAVGDGSALSVACPDTSTNSPGNADTQADSSSDDKETDENLDPKLLLGAHVDHGVAAGSLPPLLLLSLKCLSGWPHGAFLDASIN